MCVCVSVLVCRRVAGGRTEGRCEQPGRMCRRASRGKIYILDTAGMKFKGSRSSLPELPFGYRYPLAVSERQE